MNGLVDQLVGLATGTLPEPKGGAGLGGPLGAVLGLIRQQAPGPLVARLAGGTTAAHPLSVVEENAHEALIMAAWQVGISVVDLVGRLRPIAERAVPTPVPRTPPPPPSGLF